LFLYNHVLDVDMPQDIGALRSKSLCVCRP
jgi:hypothetical protein